MLTERYYCENYKIKSGNVNFVVSNLELKERTHKFQCKIKLNLLNLQIIGGMEISI